MSDRRVERAVLDTNTDKKLAITVFYKKGGINYFNYETEPSGFYVSVSPFTENGDFRTFEMGSGLKGLLEQADRFNRKKLAKFAKNLLELDETKRIIAKVCEKEGLTVAD